MITFKYNNIEYPITDIEKAVKGNNVIILKEIGVLEQGKDYKLTSKKLIGDTLV